MELELRTGPGLKLEGELRAGPELEGRMGPDRMLGRRGS